MKRIKSMVILVMFMTALTACKGETDTGSGRGLDQKTQAAEETIASERNETSVQNTQSSQERREGTSADTVVTPEDFPKEYYYGSGLVSDWSREDMLKKMPEPKENKTVLNTDPDPAEIIRLIYDKFIHTNMGIAAITAWLNQHGYKKKKRQNNTLDAFATSFIKGVLDNPVYCGKLAYGRRKNEKVSGTPEKSKDWSEI